MVLVLWSIYLTVALLLDLFWIIKKYSEQKLFSMKIAINCWKKKAFNILLPHPVAFDNTLNFFFDTFHPFFFLFLKSSRHESLSTFIIPSHSALLIDQSAVVYRSSNLSAVCRDSANFCKNEIWQVLLILAGHLLSSSNWLISFPLYEAKKRHLGRLCP